MAHNITAANATLVLSIPGILPVPQQIQGFSTDDAFTSQAIKSVEVQMGVDGQLSGGYVPVAIPTEIVLQADSPSNAFFDTWFAQQDANLISFQAQGYLTYPAIGLTYALITGFMTSYTPIAGAKKVLQPKRYEITWRKIIGTPIGLAG